MLSDKGIDVKKELRVCTIDRSYVLGSVCHSFIWETEDILSLLKKTPKKYMVYIVVYTWLHPCFRIAKKQSYTLCYKRNRIQCNQIKIII